MNFKYDASSCMQSPLSVLDLAALDSPVTAVKPQAFTSGLPPRASQSGLGTSQRSSVDQYSSSDRINFSISACKPVLTVCPNSPTRPKAQSRSRLRTARLSRSSSLNDSKVCSEPEADRYSCTHPMTLILLDAFVQVLVATKLQRTPSLACPDLFTFGNHFVFEGMIGRSSYSEVWCLAATVQSPPRLAGTPSCNANICAHPAGLPCETQANW